MPRPAEPKLDRQNLEQCPVERKLRRNSMRFPTIQALLSRFALQRRNLSRHQQEHRKRPACRQALPASWQLRRHPEMRRQAVLQTGWIIPSGSILLQDLRLSYRSQIYSVPEQAYLPEQVPD